MADCLFCKIIAGEIPGTILYQDDTLVVLKDINPQAPTHVLIVPRRHIATLNDLAPGDFHIHMHVLGGRRLGWPPG